MPLGPRGQSRAPRTHYPTMTSPDVGGGVDPPVDPGPGGGGTPPTAPSDVTLAIPGSKMICMAGYGHFNADARAATSVYDVWKSWGLAGHGFTLGGHGGPNTSQNMRGTTGVGGNSSYDWMQAMEGWGVPAINGVAYGTKVAVDFGPKLAHARDSTVEIHLMQSIYPHGDWFNDVTWAAQATRWSGLGAGMRFFGGQGVYWDFETPVKWEGETAANAYPTRTQAEYLAKVEQRGYECGLAYYTQHPAGDVMFYYPTPGGCWYDQNVYQGPGPSNNLNSNYMNWIYGWMRGGVGIATGKMAYIDARLFYRGSTAVGGTTLPTAAKWSSQGMLAEFSRSLPAASRQHWMDKIDYRAYTWASNDGGAGSLNSELSVATYNYVLEIGRQYSMGGRRADFCNFSKTPTGGSRPDGTNPVGLWANQNPYSYPPGRLAGMQAAASTSGSFSTTAPVLAATKSGSGTTRTVSGTASHPFGIRCIKAYVYPSGTPVFATMTWNLGGGSVTNISNSFMDWSLQLTGVASGNYAIVTAYSILDQQHSVVLAL